MFFPVNMVYNTTMVEAPFSLPPSHLAESLKDAVEEHKNSSTSHLGDVVQGLTGIVSHPCILVLKTGQYWLNQFREMHANGWLKGKAGTN